MPFDPTVKSRMFTRCLRHCCLCRKQCGTNIEAAHIHDESAGGSNNEDNGIPVCLDCHQEIGAYNDKHPRGNKFRPEELIARRDQIYRLVAEGRLAELAAQVKPTHQLASPLHRIIDLLTKYHCALGQVHQSKTKEALDATRNEWRSLHPAVWGNGSVRNDTIRNLADPAKEWLSEIKCPYVQVEDFNLIEEAAVLLSSFAFGSPMAMPDVYSKTFHAEDELWKRWNEQSKWYMELGGLLARLKELAARAGQKWIPFP